MTNDRKQITSWMLVTLENEEWLEKEKARIDKSGNITAIRHAGHRGDLNLIALFYRDGYYKKTQKGNVEWVNDPEG